MNRAFFLCEVLVITQLAVLTVMSSSYQLSVHDLWEHTHQLDAVLFEFNDFHWMTGNLYTEVTLWNIFKMLQY